MELTDPRLRDVASPNSPEAWTYRGAPGVRYKARISVRKDRARTEVQVTVARQDSGSDQLAYLATLERASGTTGYRPVRAHAFEHNELAGALAREVDAMVRQEFGFRYRSR